VIVCHCNRIDHHDIEEAASSLLTEDPMRLLTPVVIYKRLGKRPRCGGCLTLAANIIHTRGSQDESACAGCPMASMEFEILDAAE
jgi:bacterioferritin-associated ferredoxin